MRRPPSANLAPDEVEDLIVVLEYQWSDGTQ